jgi:hypothetical protein
LAQVRKPLGTARAQSGHRIGTKHKAKSKKQKAKSKKQKATRLGGFRFAANSLV